MFCPVEHKHAATGTCYVIHKCRCDDCRAGNSARENRRARLKAYGRFDNGLVDADPVRAHVEALRAFGLGYARIARLAGVQPRAVAALIYGRQEGSSSPRKGEHVKRIKRESAEAILSIQPSLELLGATAHVKAGPYVRRLKALVALGWSQSRLAARMGIERSNFRFISEYDAAGTHRSRVLIRASSARAIVALYDELSNVRPPEATHRERVAASRARGYARAAGWPLPMDWEAIDNAFDRPASARRSAA